MKRIVKLSGKYYGYDISNLDGDELLEDIKGFTDQYDPVIIVREYEDAESMEIYMDDITIIEND